MGQTWTITITTEGPQQNPTVHPGDWVVWENQTSEWYGVWGFTPNPPGPQLFTQQGYGIEPWASSGGEVMAEVNANYSYTCNSPNGGGIIIVERPGSGASVQQTAQKSVQGSSSKPQGNKALVTNGSRK